jgi:hypothetical protein
MISLLFVSVTSLHIYEKQTASASFGFWWLMMSPWTTGSTVEPQHTACHDCGPADVLRETFFRGAPSVSDFVTSLTPKDMGGAARSTPSIAG